MSWRKRSDRSYDLDVWGDPLLLIDGHASLTLSHFRRTSGALGWREKSGKFAGAKA
jgi:hypothetical protein